jgi:hypothetical protein
VHKCDALVRRVVAVLGAFNMVLGVQLMYDYRGEGSCHFIEVNPRPHDWSMLSDQVCSTVCPQLFALNCLPSTNRGAC